MTCVASNRHADRASEGTGARLLGGKLLSGRLILLGGEGFLLLLGVIELLDARAERVEIEGGVLPVVDPDSACAVGGLEALVADGRNIVVNVGL